MIGFTSAGGGKKVIDLGVGTSFDLSSFTGYKNFTADSFVCQPTGNASGNGSWNSGPTEKEWYVTGSYGCNFNFSKAYDSTTGKFTCSARISSSSAHQVSTAQATVPLHVFLID